MTVRMPPQVTLNTMFRILADGLDSPDKRNIVISPNNPILRSLATLDNMDNAFESLTQWLESQDPEQAILQLKKQYYTLFLAPNASVPLYLHRWMNVDLSQILQNLFPYLSRSGLSRKPGWHLGPDHLSLVLDLAAELLTKDSPEIHDFLLKLIKPWWGDFATRLSRVKSPFYQALGLIACEVNHELEKILAGSPIPGPDSDLYSFGPES